MDEVIADAQKIAAGPKYPSECGAERAAVHIGFYFGWTIQRELVSQRVKDEYAEELVAFHNRKINGPEFIRRIGNVLCASMLQDHVAKFSMLYFRSPGRFITDYVHLFGAQIAAKKPQTIFGLSDCWENQSAVSRLLDQRFATWQYYPPAAQCIFDGHEVGAGSYYALEQVTQSVLSIAALSLLQTGACDPLLVFAARDGRILVAPEVVIRGNRVNLRCDEGIAKAEVWLRESLAKRVSTAFATAKIIRMSSNEGELQQSAVEVISRHFKSCAYRVVAPYASDAKGFVKFERPVMCPIALLP